jgi:hypothetical protein
MAVDERNRELLATYTAYLTAFRANNVSAIDQLVQISAGLYRGRQDHLGRFKSLSQPGLGSFYYVMCVIYQGNRVKEYVTKV